jgi:hypothetical protein
MKQAIVYPSKKYNLIIISQHAVAIHPAIALCIIISSMLLLGGRWISNDQYMTL